MPDNISGTAEISGFFNPILERTMFAVREDALMPALVTPYSAVGWQDRKLSIYPQLTAQEVAEKQDFTAAEQMDKSLESLLTPIEIMAQTIVTDRRRETDPDGAMADAIEELSGAIVTKIETDLVTLFASFSTDKGAGANNPFTLTSVANSLAVLRARKVKGPFFVVLQPYHWLDVWIEIGKPSTALVASDAANAAMRDYFVANLINARWFQHALIPVDSQSDAYSAVFNRGALALDTRKAPTQELERDASLRAFEVNMSAGYAAGIRRDDFGVKLKADATEPS